VVVATHDPKRESNDATTRATVPRMSADGQTPSNRTTDQLGARARGFGPVKVR
jgi:hypothetical protein